ncbi:hypothetical protein mvi_52960 [Methylobacterium indicum]|uniref:Uncharacterized protein n=1 Tax=Methylobacterium indicum TaxID=1775910 RepID=A0A8H8WYP8_9HYPH|nr:hypothetical protein mvi_52960 [Methylobacterium indicum]
MASETIRPIWARKAGSSPDRPPNSIRQAMSVGMAHSIAKPRGTGKRRDRRCCRIERRRSRKMAAGARASGEGDGTGPDRDQTMPDWILRPRARLSFNAGVRKGRGFHEDRA